VNSFTDGYKKKQKLFQMKKSGWDSRKGRVNFQVSQM